MSSRGRYSAKALNGELAKAPTPLDTSLANASAYVGRYTGPAGTFEVRPGSPLTIVADGQSAALQPWGGELFRTTHPSFRAFSLLFERKGGAVGAAMWGPATYLRAGSGRPPPISDPQLARLAGRYVNDSPWLGMAQVVERGGKLWLGTETPMERIGDNLWRIGDESWSPERGSFSGFIDRRPQVFIFSAEKFLRHDV